MTALLKWIAGILSAVVTAVLVFYLTEGNGGPEGPISVIVPTYPTEADCGRYAQRAMAQNKERSEACAPVKEGRLWKLNSDDYYNECIDGVTTKSQLKSSEEYRRYSISHCKLLKKLKDQQKQ